MFGFRFIFMVPDMYKHDGRFYQDTRWRPAVDPKETAKKQRLSYQRFTGTYKPY